MISLIEMFRPQQMDAVGQILSQGNAVLQNAVNTTVQLGRDAVNLRKNQETDYLRQNEEQAKLSQRRFENDQTQQNNDRTFFESIFRDRRDTRINVARDARDFNYRQGQDKIKNDQNQQELDLRRNANDTNADLATQRNDLESQRLDLEKQRVDLLKEKNAADKTYLRSRANDILELTRPPTILESIFGGAPAPQAPATQTKLADELRQIGDALNDPHISAQGDALRAKADTEAARIKAAKPVAARGKVPQTDEQRLEYLQRQVSAWNAVEADGDELTNTDKVKRKAAALEIDQIKKRMADKARTAPAGTPAGTPAPVSVGRSYIDRVN